MDMPSDNQSKAWARLSTLTSFVSWMCFARARCSDSENVNRLIAIPPTVDFTGDKMGSVKNIMSTYLVVEGTYGFRRVSPPHAPGGGGPGGGHHPAPLAARKSLPGVLHVDPSTCHHMSSVSYPATAVLAAPRLSALVLAVVLASATLVRAGQVILSWDYPLDWQQGTT